MAGADRLTPPRRAGRGRGAVPVSPNGGGKQLEEPAVVRPTSSHELGQNFSRAFGTRFLTREGTREHAWQTSWGSTTRMVGAMVTAHGDDHGLRLPPRLAPVQVVVLAVKGEDAVLTRVRTLAEELGTAGLRVRIDDLLNQTRERRVQHTENVRTIGEAVEAAATGGWARLPWWSALGPQGGTAPAEHPVTVRCLVAEDGSVPRREDEPGTVALVARAYWHARTDTPLGAGMPTCPY
ncbi:hypothetical protein DTL70_24715 [Streptomyces diacarni]|uniref:Uncharacterized protein n=1 Tax=Streptomyces diacarni TaxID=2800381 RepID=A0A367ER72_9ACTN|nr:hypothetical protein DTL70_24715 [Streptomyces diacarni]